jgi:hypothetical protein
MKSPEFSYCLTQYLSKYLTGQRGLSTNTVMSYRDTFSLFLKYCRDEAGINRSGLVLSHLIGSLLKTFWFGWNRVVIAPPPRGSHPCLFKICHGRSPGTNGNVSTNPFHPNEKDAFSLHSLSNGRGN